MCYGCTEQSASANPYILWILDVAAGSTVLQFIIYVLVVIYHRCDGVETICRNAKMFECDFVGKDQYPSGIPKLVMSHPMCRGILRDPSDQTVNMGPVPSPA